MAESFAGITVPEGEAGELRSAAKALSGLSHDLESAARALDGQPTMLGGWVGPASVAYAGACLVSSGGVRASATAAHAAAGALRRFGEGLQDAQRDARHAIAQARDAQHRIDRAQHAIVDARARAAAAAARDSAAASKIALTSVVGVPPPDAVAEQARARSDAAAAELDGAGAQRELEEREPTSLARRPRAGGRWSMRMRWPGRRRRRSTRPAAVGRRRGPTAGRRAGCGTAGGWSSRELLGSPLTGAGLALSTGAVEQSLNLAAHGLRKLVTFRGRRDDVRWLAPGERAQDLGGAVRGRRDRGGLRPGDEGRRRRSRSSASA